MATITLAQLKTDVLRNVDMVSGSLVSDDELRRHINKGGGDLFDQFTLRYQDYLTAPVPTEFTLSPGQNVFTLPGDVVKLRGVDRQVGGGWVRVRSYGHESRDRHSQAFVGRGVVPGSDVRYREFRNTLRFEPERSAAGRYRFWYVQARTELVNDDDSIDLPNGWDDYIVLDAAIRCLEKGGLDLSSQRLRKSEMKQRLEDVMSSRDGSEQDFVRGPEDDVDWRRW